MRVLCILLIFCWVSTGDFLIDTTACYDAIQGNILNRTTAGAQQFPWHVIVKTNLETPGCTRKICSGSLIAPDWVLTTADCVAGVPPYNVSFGSIERNKQIVQMSSNRAVIHPSYDLLTPVLNVALIKLPKKVSLNKNIRTIRLPTQFQMLNTFIGLNVLVADFGITALNTNNTVTTTDTLKYSELKVMDDKACRLTSATSLTYLCLKSSAVPVQGNCTNYQGSAVVLKEGTAWTQIGMSGFLSSTCGKDNPSSYIRMSVIMNWISTVTGIPTRF